MPSRSSGDYLSNAILQSVEDGRYPEDEGVISAELLPSALKGLLDLLEQARADVKASIRELSKISAPDIDGWISQAKRLRHDIEDSQQLSHGIVAQADEGSQLQVVVDDAAAKVGLLNGEVAFNEALAGILQEIKELQSTLASVQGATVDYRLLDAVSLLQEAERQLASTRAGRNTRPAELLGKKIADLRVAVEKTLTDSWDSIIHIDATSSLISIQHETKRSTTTDIDTVATALAKLDLLRSKIITLRRGIDDVVITPRLRSQADGTVASLVTEENVIRVNGRSSDLSTAKLLSDIRMLVDYLSTNLPPAIAIPLSEILMPGLISRLKSGPLLSSVPTDLEDIADFQHTLDLVLRFANTLDQHGWQGKASLVEWTNQSPRVWLDKRRETSLQQVRKILLKDLGEPRAVERIETQTVLRDDDMFAANGCNDDWNANWSDGDNEEDLNLGSSQHGEMPGEVVEEDVSAWGLEDDIAEESNERRNGQTEDITDETDAWGWGDEDDIAGSPKGPNLPPRPAQPPKVNGRTTSIPSAGHQMTLKETYNITALPEQILAIIVQAILDVEKLSHPNSEVNPLAPASEALLRLPGLVLSLYRATAPNFYTRSISGNMFLYNDCLYISEQLRKYNQDYPSRPTNKTPGPVPKLNLEPDILTLSLFGKRAYGKEMESQRQILSDLLDGAQGFANCTEHPFAQECDLAISSTVDRLRNLCAQWKPVLSHSALLQSLGSLLSTVINKIIVDVEDMPDISEPESQRLASFCNRVATLESLFLPETNTSEPTTPAKETPIPLTAVYAPNWLKFQYLANILESSLVDIKYLWTEAGLSLEFGAEELIDLIEALFADSEHRRRAIGEIRRGTR
ncbi:MAG: hypothetical protein Q9187_005137 [Circinaria calcarea]